MSNKENLTTLVETWEEPDYSTFMQVEKSPQKSPSLPFVTPKPRVNVNKPVFSPMSSINYNLSTMSVNSPKPARLAQLTQVQILVLFSVPFFIFIYFHWSPVFIYFF